MGKKGKRQYTVPSKVQEDPYPSRYGSHKSMGIDENVGGAYVACEDEKGPYVTSRLHLDNGLTDPWRSPTESFRKAMLKKHFPDLLKEYDV